MDIKHRIDLIRLLPENPITVELGVAEGNFSEEICEKWSPKRHYSIDNWSTFGEKGDGAFDQAWHNSNKQKANNRLFKFDCSIIHQGITWEVASIIENNIDLVYIDAGHDFESVTKDILAWYPKLKPGGVMAFHDYYSRAYGVHDAVHEFCKGKYIVHEIPENKAEDGGCYFVKEDFTTYK